MAVLNMKSKLLAAVMLLFLAAVALILPCLPISRAVEFTPLSDDEYDTGPMPQEAKEVLEHAKEQLKAGNKGKKAFDLTTLRCEHCHAVVEEMLQEMLQEVATYQQKVSLAQKKDDEDGKRFRMKMTGYGLSAADSERMKKAYSEDFRKTVKSWAKKFDWEISDTTFWMNKVFGESFAGSGVSIVNPRHHIVFERKDSLCHDTFEVCPRLKGRDGSTASTPDRCRVCVNLVDDLENILGRAKGKKTYRSRAHIWDEIDQLCVKVGFNHEDALTNAIRTQCDEMVDEYEDDIGQAFFEQSNVENIARRVCVDETEQCEAEDFDQHTQRVVDGRRAYPFLSGGIYPDTIEVKQSVLERLNLTSKASKADSDKTKGKDAGAKAQQPSPVAQETSSTETPDAGKTETRKSRRVVKRVKASEAATQGDNSEPVTAKEGKKIVKVKRKVIKKKKNAVEGNDNGDSHDEL